MIIKNMTRINNKELIQVSSIKNRFSKKIILKMSDWISKEKSYEKRLAIKEITEGEEDISDSDSLFIIYKMMSLPLYVRTNLATKLKESVNGDL